MDSTRLHVKRRPHSPSCALSQTSSRRALASSAATHVVLPEREPPVTTISSPSVRRRLDMRRGGAGRSGGRCSGYGGFFGWRMARR
jgi:hypothetical protein